MALEYFYSVFVAAVGVIQATVAHNGLRGISFFSQKICSYLFAVFTTGPVLFVFFTWNERNPTGVIEGAQQFGLFMLAIVASIGFTLAMSSLLNHWTFRGNDIEHNGFEALREVTFFQAIRYSFIRFMRKRW